MSLVDEPRAALGAHQTEWSQGRRPAARGAALALGFAPALALALAVASAAGAGPAAAKPAGAGPAEAGPAAAKPAEAGPRSATPETPELFEQQPQDLELPPRDVTYEEQTPEKDQVRANQLFQKGNRRFEKRQLDDAIRLYRKAYEIWPHPIILFNMAINLGFLSNPLGAAKMFRKVLSYRKGPIHEDRYREAAENFRTLMRQLSTLRVVCKEPGAKVFVDGNLFGRAPLDRTVTLTPGRHLVSAKREGMVPYSAELTLKAGHHGRLEVQLKAFQDVVKERVVKRYHWWIPAAVTAGAVVAVGIGGGLWSSGVSEIDTLKMGMMSDFTADDNVDQQPVGLDTSRESRAKAWQITGQVFVGVAVAATAAAITLWILRKKREKYTVEGAPTVGGAGAGASWRF